MQACPIQVVWMQQLCHSYLVGADEMDDAGSKSNPMPSLEEVQVLPVIYFFAMVRTGMYFETLNCHFTLCGNPCHHLFATVWS
jgi:hypothetical protein